MTFLKLGSILAGFIGHVENLLKATGSQILVFQYDCVFYSSMHAMIYNTENRSR